MFKDILVPILANCLGKNRILAFHAAVSCAPYETIKGGEHDAQLRRLEHRIVADSDIPPETQATFFIWQACFPP